MIIKNYLRLIFAVGICLSGQSAFAQVMESEKLEIPQLSPTAGWVVQPTEIKGVKGLSGIGLPCMMKASYNNGYDVRISGASGHLLAMAIDFRQPIFTRGRQYPSNLSWAGGSSDITASAFSATTLIFNLRDIQGLYQTLPQSQFFRLNVAGNPFQFSTMGLSTSIQQLENCYNGQPVATEIAFMDRPTPDAVQPSLDVNAPRAPNHSKEIGTAQMPSQSVFDQWEQKVSRDFVDEEPRRPFKPDTVSPPTPANRRAIWRAKAGDDIQQTLNNWGAKAGVDIAWQADQSGRIVQDINMTGTFEEAVQFLMAQNATALGIEANMDGRAVSTPAYVPASMQVASPTTISRPASSYKQSYSTSSSARWQAAIGSDLQMVLRQWAAKEGVSVLWQSNVPFKVKSAVSENGDYASALQALLGQYEGDRLRPAAQLNNDPVTGERTLIIDSTRVL